MRVEPFTVREFRQYFEGLIAEGDARRSLAATLGVREDDYLAILADKVSAATFENLAHELGIRRALLQSHAQELCEVVPHAIDAASEGGTGTVFESTPFVGEGLLENMAPRMTVLEHFARGV